MGDFRSTVESTGALGSTGEHCEALGGALGSTGAEHWGPLGRSTGSTVKHWEEHWGAPLGTRRALGRH